MAVARRITLELTQDVADAIDRKLASGEYASASEIVGEGIGALMDRDEAVERWLREEVVAGHAEYLADQANTIDIDDILPRLMARRAAAAES
ncbi:MAG TPA: type II toxin-antitoxin system ParD family antitoxin [Rhizobiaceae bacterium]|nr:type II toxin-antitoxin system ParD family antitoxin [Rhizobiaceae bacterium]